ncbi:hypothetical protein, partial [Aquidulcibacter sp.]|uniref:hypothetical protein n=1 Tax=Aquidulcibacter sp. TaxID=2052990 RepID=UPI003BA6220F
KCVQRSAPQQQRSPIMQQPIIRDLTLSKKHQFQGVHRSVGGLCGGSANVIGKLSTDFPDGLGQALNSNNSSGSKHVACA